MTIDAELLDLLACPSEDHAPLRLETRGSDNDSGSDAGPEVEQVLVCTHCGSTFPIVDGIPVLLLDDATPGPNGLGNGA
jgi:uncharacterized protein YbaR (Trm112 family)